MSQDTEPKGLSRRGAWTRRLIYIALAIVVFIFIPFIIDNVGYLVAGQDWTAFRETWFSDPRSGQTFLVGFAVVVVIIFVIMYFIISAFETTEGGW